LDDLAGFLSLFVTAVAVEVVVGEDVGDMLLVDDRERLRLRRDDFDDTFELDVVRRVLDSLLLLLERCLSVSLELKRASRSRACWWLRGKDCEPSDGGGE
jgi:hypothetical protein